MKKEEFLMIVVYFRDVESVDFDMIIEIYNYVVVYMIVIWNEDVVDCVDCVVWFVDCIVWGYLVIVVVDEMGVVGYVFYV